MIVQFPLGQAFKHMSSMWAITIQIIIALKNETKSIRQDNCEDTFGWKDQF